MTEQATGDERRGARRRASITGGFPSPAGRGRSRLARVLSTVVAVVVLAAGSGAIAPTAAQEAGPDAVAITEASGLTWGVKESWRNYITSGGTFVGEGATQNPDGTFDWPFVSGTYDPVTKETVLQFGGQIEFLGHCEELGSPAFTRPCVLDLTVRNPRVEITTDHTVLVAEAREGLGPFTEIALVELDVEGVEPVVAEGTTTWSAIPAKITPQGSAFFTYQVGTVVDPVSFSYTGDGGKPVGDQWTPPGTALYRAEAVDGAPTSIRRMLHDPATGEYVATRGVSGTPIVVLDDETLQVKPGGTAAQTYATQAGIGYHPASRTVISPRSVAPNSFVVAYTWNGTSFTSANVPGTNLNYGGNAVWDPVEDRVLVTKSTGLFELRLGDGGWEATRYEPVGSGPIAVLPDGTLVLQGTTILTLPEDPADPVGQTPIPGATSGTVAVDPVTGTIWVIGNDVHSLELVEGAWTASAPTATGLSAGGTVAVDATTGDLYALATGEGGRIVQVRDGQLIRTFRPPGVSGTLSNTHWVGTVTADGALLVNINNALHKLFYVATSPTVSEHPVDQTVTITPETPTATATFTAAAVGDPAPAVRWQVRPVGVGTWSDVDGATDAELTVDVDEADAGTRYRAVFTNDAGEIGTSAALVQVHTPAGVAEQPIDVTAPADGTAEFKVMPTGNPSPTITWQRLVDGTWVDLDPQDAGYEIDGGFLTVLAVAEGDDGAQFRARLANVVSTVHSNVVTLAVDGGGPGGPGEPGDGEQVISVDVPDLGPGEFVWSISGSGAPVDLGVGVDAGDHWVFSGGIHPIQVTDTRDAAPAWSISGQVGDFTGGLPGRYLGWSPKILVAGGGATTGSSVASGFLGGDGLTEASTLASAPSGHARGGATVGADLDLRLPIDTEPGTYTATLTITALS